MGKLTPIAVIVTGDYADSRLAAHWVDLARDEAIRIYEKHELEGLITNTTDEIVNDTRSFMIGWDGSKEGWDISDRSDEARREFIAWLRNQTYSDGSCPLKWIEIQYGADVEFDDIDHEVLILNHSKEPDE